MRVYLYVVMNKKAYDEKIQNILNDTTKFIEKKSTEKLKKIIKLLILNFLKF